MEMLPKTKRTQIDRRGERGAALITTLLLATLLLTAGGALVMMTTLSAVTAVDSTAEMQAYYGAEAGLQQTLNILRGNVYNSSSTPAVTFRSIVEPSLSNLLNDSATTNNIARLSSWLTYDANNHVIVPGTSNMMAYDVSARDLDDSKHVTYATSGTFDVGSSGCTAAGSVLTCNGLTAGNSFVLTYTPQAATTVLAYPSTTTPLGSFKLAVNGIGASLPSNITFHLWVNQTLPWAAKNTVTATISGAVTSAASALPISFDGTAIKVSGTNFALSSSLANITANGVTMALNSTITAPQPHRILVQTTGYGPKGAIKRLEMEINSGYFDFDAPATVTMRGSDDGTPVTFSTGSSGAKTYSGVDNSGLTAQVPAFAFSGSDVTNGDNGISKPGTITDPMIGYLDNSTLPAGTTVPASSVPTPAFLQTANDARKFLNDLQAAATSLNRYFTPSTAGGYYTVGDSNTSPTSITFVDGNANVTGGSGLLVVTGDVNMSGNPSFNGVILALGGGSVNRNGGGNGSIYGGIFVANFDRNGTGGFGGPIFNTNGGGASTLQYDSLAVSKALGAVGIVVGGIREY
jgi:hypothetical protein